MLKKNDVVKLDPRFDFYKCLDGKIVSEKEYILGMECYNVLLDNGVLVHQIPDEYITVKPEKTWFALFEQSFIHCAWRYLGEVLSEIDDDYLVEFENGEILRVNSNLGLTCKRATKPKIYHAINDCGEEVPFIYYGE